MNKVLITGASGPVGAAAVEKFLAEGWEVVAVSRRVPEVSSERAFHHVAVDLQDADACREAFGSLSDVTHVVYAAVFDKPGLIAGWTERDQMETNLAMLRNLIEPLTEVESPVQHVSFLQGTKAYGIHLHPMPIPARERAPRDPQAAGETFNVTNGEVCEWRNLWPMMAETLGVKPGPDSPVSLATFLPEKAEVWDRIVHKYGLRPLSMTELLGESHHYADFCFAYGADEGPRPFLSTIELKQAGFTETMDTEETFRFRLQNLIDRRILPSPD